MKEIRGIKLKKSKSFVMGATLLSVVSILALISIIYTPYDPNEMNSAIRNLPPHLSHPFGTDNFGRDLFSRCMYGARTTLMISFIIVAIGAFFGTLIGAISGYFGGVIDEILMRINDAFLAFPYLILALIFISITGPGDYSIIIALGIIFIPSFARMMRSEFMTIKEREFIKVAKLTGISNLRIILHHILPNTLPILLSTITIGFNNAVLVESSISYLGLGVQPPSASLGRMLSEAQGYLFVSPWYAIAPGAIIVITILSVSLINDKIAKVNEIR